jgi:hypothetical protein
MGSLPSIRLDQTRRHRSGFRWRLRLRIVTADAQIPLYDVETLLVQEPCHLNVAGDILDVVNDQATGRFCRHSCRPKLVCLPKVRKWFGRQARASRWTPTNCQLPTRVISSRSATS